MNPASVSTQQASGCLPETFQSFFNISSLSTKVLSKQSSPQPALPSASRLHIPAGVWTVWAATKVESNVACQWFTMTTLFQHFGQHLTCSCRCEQSQNGITLFLLRFIRGFWMHSHWKFIRPRKNSAVFAINIYRNHVLHFVLATMVVSSLAVWCYLLDSLHHHGINHGSLSSARAKDNAWTAASLGFLPSCTNLRWTWMFNKWQTKHVTTKHHTNIYRPYTTQEIWRTNRNSPVIFFFFVCVYYTYRLCCQMCKSLILVNMFHSCWFNLW